MADGGMSQLDSERRRELLTVLTAEHSNLQGARTSAIQEANGRMTAFFAALSGSLVALAFIAQVGALREILIPVALVLTWIVLYVGLLTFLRLVQLTVLDATLVVGINRIRRRYLELVPELGESEVLSQYDDLAGIVGQAGLTGRMGSTLDLLAAAPGMVAGINGMLAGVIVAVVAAQVGASGVGALIVGVAAGVVTDAAQFLYGLRSGVQFWKAHPPRYPTPQG